MDKESVKLLKLANQTNFTRLYISRSKPIACQPNTALNNLGLIWNKDGQKPNQIVQTNQIKLIALVRRKVKILNLPR